MPIEDLVKQVAVTLERDGGAQAVFGPSIELAHHVIVPVAVVSGGAAGAGSQASGGLGLGLNVRPVGFIHESGDHVVFTPIHVDDAKRSVFTEAAHGLRRAIDLAFSLVTQFVQGSPPKAPRPPRTPGDAAAVSSPS